MKRFNKRIVQDRIARDDDLFEVQNITPNSIRLRPLPEVTQEGTMINEDYLQPIEDYLDVLETEDGHLQDTRGVVANQAALNHVNGTATTALNIANAASTTANNAMTVNNAQNERLDSLETDVASHATRLTKVEIDATNGLNAANTALETAGNAINIANEASNNVSAINDILDKHEERINEIHEISDQQNQIISEISEKVENQVDIVNEAKELANTATIVNNQQDNRLANIETAIESLTGGDVDFGGLNSLRTLVYASKEYNTPTLAVPQRYFLEIQNQPGTGNAADMAGYIDITITGPVIQSGAPIMARYIITYSGNTATTIVRPIELTQNNMLDLAIDRNPVTGTHRICVMHRVTQLHSATFFAKINVFAPRTPDQTISWIDTTVREAETTRVEGAAVMSVRRNNVQTTTRHPIYYDGIAESDMEEYEILDRWFTQYYNEEFKLHSYMDDYKPSKDVILNKTYETFDDVREQAQVNRLRMREMEDKNHG